MYLSTLRKLLLAAVLFVLSLSTSVMAATVSIVPSGNTSYVIQGNGMDGVAGIELNIRYDTARGTPTVKQGSLVSGAMLAANTSSPGSIKIAIISTREFSGSGPIATITFASKSASASPPNITSSSMIDSKGSQLASSTGNPAAETAAAGTNATPGATSSQPSSTPQQSTSATATASTTSGTTPIYSGTVTLPADQQQQADSQPATSSTDPLNTEEPAATTVAEQTQPAGKPAADSKPEETPQYVVYKGILERFKQYNGSKDLTAIAALFDKKVAQTIHQEPAILLSDGQAKATLTVDIPARINTSPNFAVKGGTLVSFKQDKQSKSRWIVEVLPESGTVKATLTIIAGAEEFEFPLTVTPPAKTALTLDELGWKRFIKEVGTSSAPLHDLNNDGVRDYMDEFIFVANYLAGKSTPTKPASASKKTAK